MTGGRGPCGPAPDSAAESPIRRDRAVTCADFVAAREWMGATQAQFCGFFGIGPAAWAAMRRAAAAGADFPGGPPLVAAPYALAARWVDGRHAWLPPLARPEPALVLAALRRALGPDAPSPGALALALGRDAGAAGAWLRGAGAGANASSPQAAVRVAAALLFCGPESLLAGRWRAWWAMANREAALRGVAPLARVGSWQVTGALVVPPGRWGARPACTARAVACPPPRFVRPAPGACK